MLYYIALAVVSVLGLAFVCKMLNHRKIDLPECETDLELMFQKACKEDNEELIVVLSRKLQDLFHDRKAKERALLKQKNKILREVFLRRQNKKTKFYVAIWRRPRVPRVASATSSKMMVLFIT